MNKIFKGDSLVVLKSLENDSVDCIITSPPYWGLRDYGMDGQLGAESTLEEYLKHMLAITAECRRVLKDTGTFWWNHGDSYAGKNQGDVPDKSLIMQSYRLAIRMVDDQKWILRNTLIWHKPNVMPASVKDRFTVDFEPVFFFTKSKQYYFEIQREPLSQVSIERVKYGWKSKKANGSVMSGRGINVSEMGERFANPLGRNKRTVWRIPTSASRTLHVAMFPEKLIEPMIRAGCPEGGGRIGSILWLGDHRSRGEESWQGIYWHRAQSGIYQVSETTSCF